MPSIGTHDLCPCGSGKVYEDCHLSLEEIRPATQLERALALHAKDEALTTELLRVARSQYGCGWLERVIDRYPGCEGEPREEDLQMLLSWSLYHFDPGEGTPAELALAEQGYHPSEGERRWIEANRAAWITVWEVQEIREGTGLVIRDLLTGHSVFVYERSGSHTLVPRETIVGRVVQFDDLAVLGGIHPQPLPPSSAERVVTEVRRFCGTTAKRLTPQALRAPDVDVTLLKRWQAEVDEFSRRPPATLSNTDGEPLVLVTDTFGFAAGDRPLLESRLASLEEVSVDGEGEAEISYVFSRSGKARHPERESAIIGRAAFEGDTFRLETNSARRADELRRRVEESSGGSLHFQSRNVMDQEELWHRARAKSHVARPETAPESEA
jgi:hypothetical protein